MPGLFGIITSALAAERHAGFDAMFGPAARAFTTESLNEPGTAWALGRTEIGGLQPAPQLEAGRPLQVLLHGDVYLDDGAPEAHPPRSASSARVAALYRQHGDAFVRHLTGAYCVAIVDTEKRRVVLASDRVGSYPLYYTATARGFVFASELRAVLRHPDVRRALDPHAVADYIAFGFPFGTKTLAAGVQMVPAAATVVYDMDTAAIAVRRYAEIADAFQPWEGSQRDYLEGLEHAFQQSVDRAMSGPHRFGLSLSGGLDSRAILSGINGAAATLSTYTLGVRGCADEAIADRLARIAGTRHTFFELDARYLKDFLPNLRRMVSLTDGMYLSHGLTEMLALMFLESADFSVLLRGHGGELAKTRLAWPLHTDAQVDTFRSTDQLIPYLLTRVNYISPGVDPQMVFSDSWAAAIQGAARASLEAGVAGVPLSPGDLCSYLYLTQFHRRSTIPSLELFREVVAVRMPFVDPAFLDVLFRAHHDWRGDTRIHRALTASKGLRLLKVRNSNTGAPGNAGPRTEYVLDKVNTIFKRLNVPGYRHYHNFQEWMREQLLTSVETELLSRASLERGVLREDGVRRLLDDTRAGRGDHSYLLQVLLILELWQKEHL